MKWGWKFWLVTMAAILAVATTASLGRWQLSRAAEKMALQSSTDTQFRAQALDTQALASHADPTQLIHRRLKLRALWLTDRTVFLDNRQMGGRVGMYALTPLQLEGSALVVLVQRGWVPRNFLDRTALAPIQTPLGSVEMEGRIVPPPFKLYEIGPSQTGRIRQNLDLRSFSAELGVPLMAMSVQQTGATSEGLLRDWPVPATGVDKHYGYAFQWFSLCGLISILYVWFQLVRRFISAGPS